MNFTSKHKILPAFLVTSALLMACQSTESNDQTEAPKTKVKPPNIIMFLVDDMGPFDTSHEFYSEHLPQNDFFKTPNMERLGKMSVSYTRAYACAVCSPSRVSLMTGMNATRHRVTNWTLIWGKSTDDRIDMNGVILPQWNFNGISVQKDVPNTCYCPATLPQRLKDAGYQTLHLGKAHFGATKVPAPYQTAEDPLRLGFERNIGGWAGGAPQTYYPPYVKGWAGQHGLPGMKKYETPAGRKGTHLTKALAMESRNLLDSAIAADKPYFLYYSQYAVHSPFEMDVRYQNEFKDDTVHNQTNKNYASLVRGMDESLGELLDYLEAKKQMDNTIIIFMADNGGYALNRRFNSNAPLSAGKGSAHEGGIRVPLMIYDPTGPKNKKDPTPVIVEDMFQTILDYADVNLAKLPENQKDGQSLRSKIDYNRPLYFHFPNRWGEQGSGNLNKPGPGYGPASYMVCGDWKYIYYHEPARVPNEELFNLKKDISETQNLKDSHPAELKKYRKMLSDHLRKVDAQMPMNKASKKPIPYPDEMK